MDFDDDDVTDLTDGATDATIAAVESDAAAERKVRTATGDAAYNVDWDGIGSSDDPTLAALRLLHSARQMVDTSRWWTFRCWSEWVHYRRTTITTIRSSYITQQ